MYVCRNPFSNSNNLKPKSINGTELFPIQTARNNYVGTNPSNKSLLVHHKAVYNQILVFKHFLKNLVTKYV